MFSRIFDLPDAVALTRALIPWTAAILNPAERQSEADLLQRTTLRHEAEEDDFDARYSAIVEAARASRAAHLGEILANAAYWIQSAVARLRHSDHVRGQVANP